MEKLKIRDLKKILSEYTSEQHEDYEVWIHHEVNQSPVDGMMPAKIYAPVKSTEITADRVLLLNC